MKKKQSKSELKNQKANIAVRNIYRKKCLSRDVRYYHYNTTVKPKILCGWKTLLLNGCKRTLQDLKRKVSKILGPVKMKLEVMFWDQTERDIYFCPKITCKTRKI